MKNIAPNKREAKVVLGKWGKIQEGSEAGSMKEYCILALPPTFAWPTFL